MHIDRRNFLYTLGAAGVATGVAGCIESGKAQTTAGSTTVDVPELINGSVVVNSSVTLPDPNASGIEHIVVVTMENRSFDHFLGWLPGADGIPAGVTYRDASGNAHSLYELGPDYEGCGHPDPDHSYANSRVAYDGGAMDGFLRAGNNDIFSIGYYAGGDLPFYSALAQNYLVGNRYFASILGPTFANRMFLWAAQTDRLDDSIGFTNLTTIFDRLSDAGISHQYYFNNVPYLALWGFKYLFSTSFFADFLTNAAAGTLPAVSFVDPVYTVLDDGTGNDDHPHADIRNGDAFLANIYNVLSTSPAWPNTVLIITFDEWGGFFEHVAPPRVAAASCIDQDQANGQVLLGFRVPAIIVSPFTQNAPGQPPLLSQTVFDHTSISKLIEWRWRLPPLTPRDASPQIGNPATAMSFASPNTVAPALPSPSTVFATPCFEGGIFSSSMADRSPQLAVSEWGKFAAAPAVKQWKEHPKFRAGAWRK